MNCKFVLPVLAMTLAVTIATGQTITSFAGNGTAGYSGDNIPATQAQINRVVGLAADAAGNIYMAEELNNRVRKVDTNGVITTIAGTGTAGFSGDQGPAQLAQLSGPLGVCVSSSGDIFINDQGNKRIRKISAAGLISTYAGNGASGNSGDGSPATQASFTIPIRCAVDANSNLFIVDQGAHVIRKVDTSGTITRFAGNGSQGFSGDSGPALAASMNNPTALAFDPSGNLYVTDQLNQRIRMIDTTGKITTVAGNGNIGFSGDGSTATTASLNYPGGIVTDSSGSLYIVDTVNNRIRKVSGGTITTIAGTGSLGFAGDNGPALQAQFSNPFAVTIDQSGSLYVGDVGNNRVRKITNAAVTGAPTITAAGVTNAASFQSGLSPGAIITIFGTNLGASPGQIVIAPGAPWPNGIGGTTVLMNGFIVPAYRVLNLSGQEQLSVQAPFALYGLNATNVQVTTASGSSIVQVPVQAAQPGIFILDGASSGATHANGSVVTASSPAARLETVVIYLTGLGPTSPAIPTGSAAPNSLTYAVLQPTVTIGGLSVTPDFAGLTPGFIGLYQINVKIPGAVAGGLVDLTVQSNGVTSNVAKIAIQ